MKFIDRDTLKMILKQAKGEAAGELKEFVEDNGEALLGLPVEAVQRIFNSAGADDAYADMQEELYRAMGAAERADFHRKSLNYLRRSREQVTRLMVLLDEARQTLTDVGRGIVTTVLSAL